MNKTTLRGDFLHFPCSRRGSYLAITSEHDGRVGIRDARIRFAENLLWQIEFVSDGQPLRELTSTLGAGWVNLRGEGGEACFVVGSGPEDILFEVKGWDMVFRMADVHFGYGIRRSGTEHFKIHSSTAGNCTWIELAEGGGSLDGPPESLPMGGGITRPRDSDLFAHGGSKGLRGRVQVGFEESLLPMNIGFEESLRDSEASWHEFLGAFPAARGETASVLAERAVYTLWSSMVPKGPVLPTEACLMSKEFMTAVWSWDHCFNAMALSLAPGLYREAREQFFLPFHFQSRSGALPDSVAPALCPIWGVSKSPIHGMAADFLLDRDVFSGSDLHLLRDRLAAWTKFYQNERDLDGNGLPEVPMGCDNWDNGSCFLTSFFVESASTAAFLVRQLETLARLDARLGIVDGPDWMEHADELTRRLLATCTEDGNFPSRSATGQPMPEPTSLNPHQILALGARLPASNRTALLADYETRFAGPFGPASETRSSKFYGEDDYWLGSVWAPTVWLLHRGLSDAGETDAARNLALSWLHGVETAQGMYETHSYDTGRPLRARAYTWTASVTILMLHALEMLEDWEVSAEKVTNKDEGILPVRAL